MTFGVLMLMTVACQTSEPEKTPEPPKVEAPAVDPAVEALQKQAAAMFPPLPDDAAGGKDMGQARLDLGRMLYYDTRLSKNQDISCNSCHQLDSFGVDGKPTSPGHKGQLGGRNSPTVYNAALHAQQFWDGRAIDVEAQAKGPVLNPIEMAMPDEATVVKVLKSIPGYAEAFAAAFPGQPDPITYDNMATAIGAFERKLLTPSRYDQFAAGNLTALSPEEQAGLKLFIETGCTACHNGTAFGGGAGFMKLGAVVPYDTKDLGRFDVTQNEADKFFFKVPSLRNVAKTGPYLHDGSVGNLEEMITLMGKHQLGKDLTPEQTGAIRVFLESLTGEVDVQYIALPKLPESGPDTPKPDPS